MSKRYLCAWLPNWPVQRIQAAEPQLAEQPLLLSGMDPRRGMLVSAANLCARRSGVKPGMRLSEANALVDAQIREHDANEDIEQLCSLAENSQQFSPTIGLEQLDPKRWTGRHLHQPECLLLDLSGLGSLFGNEENLVFQYAHWLHRQGYFACLAVADSIGAAWALANYAIRHPNPQSEIILTDRNPQFSELPPPRYQQSIPGQDEPAIQRLPPAALRLPPETVESLARLGISNIGQLATLPRPGLATRLGKQLIDRWDQAAGRKNEPLVALHSLPDWCLEQTLEHPTSHRSTVEEIARRLISQLAQRLQKRGEGTTRVVCRLDMVEAPPLVLQLGLFRPSNDAQHLHYLLAGQLEQTLRKMLQTPIWRMSLQATMTTRMAWRQTSLFEQGEASDQQQIARLVDTLSNRLGRKQVVGIQLTRETQPELAFRAKPLTGRRNDGTPQDSVKKLSTRLARRRAAPSVDDPLRRPTHLLPSPVQLETRTTTPQAVNDTIAPGGHTRPPQQFKYQGQWYTVERTWGPERLESGWWRGPSQRRDYFRVQTQRGAWWWIFRDLRTNQWHLHGWFD